MGNDRRGRRKKKVPRDHITGFIPIGDYVAAHIVEPCDPHARPVYKLLIGRTENRTSKYLRIAKMEHRDVPDSEVEFEYIHVPREEMVYTGDVVTDAWRVMDVDLNKLLAVMVMLRERQAVAEKEWQEQRKQRKPQHRQKPSRNWERKGAASKTGPVSPNIQVFRDLVAEPRVADSDPPHSQRRVIWEPGSD